MDVRNSLEAVGGATIVPLLTLDTLKSAILTFARTEDHEYVLHPEQLVTSMSAQRQRSCRSGSMHSTAHGMSGFIRYNSSWSRFGNRTLLALRKARLRSLCGGSKKLRGQPHEPTSWKATSKSETSTAMWCTDALWCGLPTSSHQRP
jgi:hypothetical protein